MNLSGFPSAAAGFNAAWSALYLIMRRRGKLPRFELRTSQFWGQKAMGPMCVMNVVGGGLVYVMNNKRTREENENKFEGAWEWGVGQWRRFREGEENESRGRND